MLELVGDLCRRLRVGFATQTGSLSPGQRRQEINRFRDDAACRVLLSTDVGGGGLSLQNASVVIHCDQPWNPARLAQRVARAWRKDQSQAVTVLNLISERTIEQRMLGMLANQQALSDSVLDQGGDPSMAKLVGGNDNPLQRLELLLSGSTTRQADAGNEPTSPRKNGGNMRQGPEADRSAASDRPRAFCRRAVEALNGALISCEERFPSRGNVSVLLVVVENELDRWKRKLGDLATECLENGPDNDPAPEIQLEIIDRAASETLRRLAESGVIHPSLRASRVLYPVPEIVPSVPLSALEQNRARQAREQHARKLKMARVLAGEEMIEESRAAVLSSIHELGRALAIEHRQSEPANALGALVPPLDAYWSGGEPTLIALRSFLSDEHAPVQPILTLLGQPVESGAKVARDFFAGIKAKLATLDS